MSEQNRTPAGTPAGGQFASHDRAEAEVTLPPPPPPMPEVMSEVTFQGAKWRVNHVDDRTAVISRDGEMKIVSDRDLGIDQPAAPRRAPRLETLRARRGHKFYTAAMDKWPAIGTHAETPLAEIPIVGHYFSPNADWYVAEYDAESGNAWGYVRFAHMPDGAEWGQFHLPELEQIHPSPLYIVERDLYWDKAPAGEVIQ